MSRFAVDPRLLIYLPPTMSPPETSALDGWLEHPAEAFGYYAKQGVTQVIAQEKHMGSRAIVVLGRDADAVRPPLQNRGCRPRHRLYANRARLLQ